MIADTCATADADVTLADQSGGPHVGVMNALCELQSPRRLACAHVLSRHVEPMTGIEPAYSAWEADVLPLNYIGAAAQKG